MIEFFVNHKEHCHLNGSLASSPFEVYGDYFLKIKNMITFIIY